MYISTYILICTHAYVCIFAYLYTCVFAFVPVCCILPCFHNRGCQSLVPMCVCMYCLIYIHICTNLFIYILACMYTYVVCVCMCLCLCLFFCVYPSLESMCAYGVATLSRIDKITGLFCKRDR